MKALDKPTYANLSQLGKTMNEEINQKEIAMKSDDPIVTARKSEVNLKDSTSIMFFGTKAQEQLTEISDKMLEGVKNKDVGAAGGALNEIVSVLRGFDVMALDPNKKPGLFDKLLGRAKPVAKFLQRYEEVRHQIESTAMSLEQHKTRLLTDIAMLDRLYEANLQYFHDLDAYILAGDSLLQDLDGETIPQFATAVDQSGNTLEAQELRDLRSARDDLERRVHDLRLTRQVAMQSLPGIRLVQENDKSLVNKITSTVANTIPLWRQQLATAVTIHRSGEAARTVKAATDLTNDLLQANAESLKVANREVRTQVERGVFDIDAIKQANQKLIDTIEESLQIADDGKRKRAEAVVELEACESQLRQTLSSASAKSSTQ